MNKFYESPDVVIEFYTFDSAITTSGEGGYIPGEEGGFGDDESVDAEGQLIY